MSGFKTFVDQMIPTDSTLKPDITTVTNCIGKFRDYWMGRKQSISLHRASSLQYGFCHVLEMSKSMLDDNKVSEISLFKITRGYYFLHRIDEKKFLKCLTVPSVKIVGEERHEQMTQLKKDAGVSYVKLCKLFSWDKLLEKFPEICEHIEKVYKDESIYERIDPNK